MDENELLRWLQWGMFGIALLLSLATVWNALLNPASSGLARATQWLAVCAAVTMVGVTAVMLRSEMDLSEWDVNPAPTIGIFGGMAGLLGVVSTMEPPRVILIGAIGAGLAGLLGGTLIFLASWRSV
ncbi:MAG: hypothetical protein ABEJ57_00980 [Halobacteriaceae archaeon]